MRVMVEAALLVVSIGAERSLRCQRGVREAGGEGCQGGDAESR